MIRVSVFYPNSDGAKFDMAYYTSKHMPMAKALMKSCKAIGADLGLAGPGGAKPTYIAIGHLFFDSVEEFEKGFAQHANEIVADVPNYTNVRPIIQINEIKL